MKKFERDYNNEVRHLNSDIKRAQNLNPSDEDVRKLKDRQGQAEVFAPPPNQKKSATQDRLQENRELLDKM